MKTRSCINCFYSKHTSTGSQLYCSIRMRDILYINRPPGFIRYATKSKEENNRFDVHCLKIANACGMFKKEK
jgi:histidinol-phosphate/aromatic aminotransferase/cobyric acid decarboxylase-like protein